ncbi:MAG: amino acid ABC transporter substrate-binding protein [Candidatus Ornithospirochaeta sp.]
MKKIIVMAIALALTFSSLFAQGAQESAGDQSLEKIQKKGVFVLGLDDSFPPMGYRDENNEIVGFDIDLAREVCKGLGVELKCQPIDWAAKEQELATGQIDCIWNGFTKTEERAKTMTLSIAYVNNAQVVVVKGGSDVKTLNDLKGKSVGVQAGSSGEEAINDTEGFAESVKEIVPYRDYLTALMDLEIGGVDAVVMDLLVANDNINRSGKDFKILDETLCAEEYVIGFRKGEEALCSAVEKELYALKENGKLAEIATKWFGADITVVGK